MIVEDDPLIVAQLEGFLDQTGLFAPPRVASDCTQAMTLLHEQAVDLLFLDIELPDMNGLDFLRTFPHPCPTVVVSAYPRYAVDCYDHDVDDFLSKPLSYARFLRSIRRTVLHTQADMQRGDVEIALAPMACDAPPLSETAAPTHIYLKAGHINQRFAFSDILYLEAANIYAKVIAQSGTTVVSDTISGLEARLSPHNFIRVHKSYVINLTQVTRYSARTIWLEQHAVPIGRKYQNGVRESLREAVGRGISSFE